MRVIHRGISRDDWHMAPEELDDANAYIVQGQMTTIPLTPRQAAKTAKERAPKAPFGFQPGKAVRRG